MNQKLLILILFLFTGSGLFAQSGTIKGKVTDKQTGEPIPFATILILDDGVQIKGANTDFDGNYIIANVPVGTYTLKVSNIGYNTHMLNNYLIKADKVEFQNFELTPNKKPSSYSSKNIEKRPPYNAVVSTVRGVSSRNGEIGKLPKNRKDGKVYLVDGKRVAGNDNYKKTATIKGKVTDKNTGEPIPFATILILDDGVQIKGVSSDYEGKYLITNAPVGTFTLKVGNIGYNSIELSDFLIEADKVDFKNFELSKSINQGDNVVRIAYKIPLINKENTTATYPLTSERNSWMPPPARLKGQVTDIETGRPISFAKIDIIKEDTVFKTTMCNREGNYLFPQVPAGSYTFQVSDVDYISYTGIGNIVREEKHIIFNFKLYSKKSSSYSSRRTENMPPINAVVSTVKGVSSRNGEIGKLPKDRKGGKVYMVDGKRVAGNDNYKKTATIKGKVTDKQTGEPIPFSTIQILDKGVMIKEAISDFDGNYLIVNAPIGKFSLTVSNVHYNLIKLSKFKIKANKVRTKNFKLSVSTQNPEVVKIRYLKPNIHKENTKAINPITAEEIERMPDRKSSYNNAGTLKGKVTDKNTGGPIPFATILILDDGVQIKGVSSDYEGKYLITNAPVGTFTLKVGNIGYNSIELSDFLIEADKVTFYNFKLSPSNEEIEEVVKTSYRIPIIDKDNTIATYPLTSERIERMPARKIKNKTYPEGNKVYLVDGVWVTGNDFSESDKVSKKSFMNSLAEFVFNILF